MEMNDAVCQFMYGSDDEYVLMNSKTLEEYSVPSKLMDANLAKLLEGGSQVKVRLSKDKPVMVTAGATLKCTVAEVMDSRESDKKKYCRHYQAPNKHVGRASLWCKAGLGSTAPLPLLLGNRLSLM